MKSIAAILTFVIVIVLFSFDKKQNSCSNTISYSNERHQYASVPPAGKTGAPGESTCFSCHTISLNGPLGNNLIQFNSGINFYKPDSTYTITVSIAETGMKVFGYEATMLDTFANKTGTFFITDSLTNAYQNLLGRDYISHKDATNNMSLDSLEWQFNWTAPSSNAGPITIYSAGVAYTSFVSAPFGNVYSDSLIIYPDSSIFVAINELSTPSVSATLYPNPISSGKAFLSYILKRNESVQIAVYNIEGQLLESFDEGSKNKGVHKFILPTENYSNGIYFIVLSNSIESKTIKFIITE